MIKRSFFFFVCLFSSIAAHAQAPMADTAAPGRTRLRISLLTCGTGEEVYETFGHTAVRVVDSNIEGPLGDLVYNYGMFNGYDENFEMKFMRGKLRYYVATNLFSDFMQEYTEYGRSVQEQVLILDEKKKEEIKTYMEVNTLPENKYYKYDFFFDNCATRIRDIFPRALGEKFAYSQILPPGYQPTFRDIINRYFYRKHWERVGVNILLGSKIDKVMSNMDIMFLPDYLRDGVAGAKVAGQKFSTTPFLLLPGSGHVPAGPNIPLLLSCSILVLTIIGLSVQKLRILGRIMSTLLLLVSGLLGWLILVMWLGTDHQGCSNNFNILWALPLNLFLAFLSPRGKDKYAIVAMVLIVISLLLHVLHIQAIIPELLPLLLSLLMVHGAIYRHRKLKHLPTNE